MSVRRNSSSKPENLGSTKHTSENLGREKYELRMLFCSANFEESRVTYGSEDSGDLSLRDACLGNREAQIEDLSTQAMLIPDAKATMEKESKEVINKEGT